MEKTTPIEKQLQEILVGEDFARLNSFKEAATWSQMTPTEKDMLAMLFVLQGEQQLQEGNNKVLESFDIASQISPRNPFIFYRQALSFGMQSSNVRCLEAACKALEISVTLDPDLFGAWSAWGCMLMRLGMSKNDVTFLQEAQLKFEEALLRAEKATPDQKAELYWQWGVCWASLGKASGEAHDFHMALSKYRLAAELGFQHAEFWKQYGDAIAEIALLMGKSELFVEAVELFRNSIKLAPDSFHSWLGLACSFQRLCDLYKDDSYFDLANDSFEKAAELNPDSVDLWLNWGVLFAESGKNRNEIEHFNLSFEKFAQANICEENHPIVFSRWGEAQMFCGAYTERAELLRQAEAKIVKSLEINSENPDTWYIYGSCLNELGRYFGDVGFYHQAIEKFRYGLTLNDKHTWLWHGLALSHFAVGEMLEDGDFVEKSVRFCGKVMECGGQSFPQFWNDWGVALMKLSEMTDDKAYVELAIQKFEHAIGKPEDDRYSCDIEWLYNYGCALDLYGSFSEEVENYEKAAQVLTFVVQQDPSYHDARYNLALSLSHLGEWTDDVEYLQRALEHFQILLSEDSEMESAWHDWGVTLMHLSALTYNPLHPDRSQALYSQAEEKLQHAIALGCSGAYYSLACLYSLMANYTAAMHYIERASHAHVLPAVDDLMHDDWLDGLRNTTDFRNFISLLRKGTN